MTLTRLTYSFGWLKQAGMTKFRGVIEFVLFAASILKMRFTFCLIAQNIHQLETTFLIK